MADVSAGLSGTDSDRASTFSWLLDRCLDRTFRMAAVILGNRDDAEDAVNDAALRAWLHLGSLRDPARFDAWFSRIVVNVCRDRLHERGRRPSMLFAEPSAAGDPFRAADERDALLAGLAALTPEHRAVVALHYLEGLTVDQIAARLGARPGTVKSRLHYGVAELRLAYEAAASLPQGAVR